MNFNESDEPKTKPTDGGLSFDVGEFDALEPKTKSSKDDLTKEFNIGLISEKNKKTPKISMNIAIDPRLKAYLYAASRKGSKSVSEIAATHIMNGIGKDQEWLEEKIPMETVEKSFPKWFKNSNKTK